MVCKDIAGNPLNEGDQVFFGTAFGQAVVGVVQKVDSLVSGAPNSQPLAHVGFTLSLPVMPNGLVGGILKIVPPKQEPLISS
jgi:hypothetical protein